MDNKSFNPYIIYIFRRLKRPKMIYLNRLAKFKKKKDRKKTTPRSICHYCQNQTWVKIHERWRREREWEEDDSVNERKENGKLQKSQKSQRWIEQYSLGGGEGGRGMHLHMCSEGLPDGMIHGAEQGHRVHWNQRGINRKVFGNDQKQCNMVLKCGV